MTSMSDAKVAAMGVRAPQRCYTLQTNSSARCSLKSAILFPVLCLQIVVLDERFTICLGSSAGGLPTFAARLAMLFAGRLAQRCSGLTPITALWCTI